MKWTPEFHDYKSVLPENAKLVLDEANKNLEATEADADKLSATSIYILGVLIAVLSTCAGFLIKSLDTPQDAAGVAFQAIKMHKRLSAVYAVAFVYVGILTLRLIHGAFRARELEHCGNSPENLVRKEYMRLTHSELLLLEACSYRDRIHKNAKRNEDTGRAINAALKGLGWAPAVCVLAWLALAILL